MMSSLITGVSGSGKLSQVIDAKGDRFDCQLRLLSRKMTAPACDL
jgi:hypothetical protein